MENTNAVVIENPVHECCCDCGHAENSLVEKGWPPALARATVDSFHFMVQLKNGTTIRFGTARNVNGVWAHLDEITEFYSVVPTGLEQVKGFGTGHGRCFERGIDVLVSDIALAVDAPFGS